MRKDTPNKIFIGYDPKEKVASDVLQFTIERTSINMPYVELNEKEFETLFEDYDINHRRILDAMKTIRGNLSRS